MANISSLIGNYRPHGSRSVFISKIGGQAMVNCCMAHVNPTIHRST